MTDKLIDCPLCKEKSACYMTSINEFHHAYSCLGCGFNTNDLMRDGEFDIELYEENLPELYKDIKRKDSDNRVWYPNIVNIEGKGTVFISGKSKDEWVWSAIKSIELTDEDKKNSRFKNQKYKSDSKTLKDFGSNFLDALEYIDIDF